jgi:type IV pilus assembly protein PilM
MFGIKDILSRVAGVRSHLGVDIGTTSIKVVELKRVGQFAQLTNYALLESYGHFERPNNVIQANALKISVKETAALLKLLLKRVQFVTDAAAASVPSFASFVTMIEMPQMDKAETERAMSFQVKQNIPLPLSEVAVDWMKVGERQDEDGFTKQQILVIAIPNETIARYREIFRGAGLALRALEVENLAFVRATVGNDATPTLIVDIGARSTNVSVIDQGFLKHNTQIDYAGDTLTQAIVKGLGISYRRAEDLKKQRGIIGGNGEYELSTLQMPFADVILQEVRKVKDAFEGNFGVRVQRVLLIGGGANLIGLDALAEERLGVPTVLGNGLLYVQTSPELSVVAKELGTRFATAIGLAVKSVI